MYTVYIYTLSASGFEIFENSQNQRRFWDPYHISREKIRRDKMTNWQLNCTFRPHCVIKENGVICFLFPFMIGLLKVIIRFYLFCARHCAAVCVVSALR